MREPDPLIVAEGRQAFYQGLSITDNPYFEHLLSWLVYTDEASDWRAGWISAQEQENSHAHQ